MIERDNLHMVALNQIYQSPSRGTGQVNLISFLIHSIHWNERIDSWAADYGHGVYVEDFYHIEIWFALLKIGMMEYWNIGFNENGDLEK